MFQVRRTYVTKVISDKPDLPDWVKEYSTYDCIYSNDDIALLKNKKQGYEVVSQKEFGISYVPIEK